MGSLLWDMTLLEPQAQLDGMRQGCQLYLNVMVSGKPPCVDNIGIEVSQIEAPFSCANSIALCIVYYM